MRYCRITLAAALVAAVGATAAAQGRGAELSGRVEILRTAHGVPHIRAQDLRAAYYALGYLMVEDHGPKVAQGLLRARGEMGRWFGRDSMEGDFLAQRAYRVATEHYQDLDQATRDAYEGFAMGVNRYIATHASEFPAGFEPAFTGYDVAARDVGGSGMQAARRFLAKVDPASRTRRGASAAPPNEPAEGVDASGVVIPRERSDRGTFPPPVVATPGADQGSSRSLGMTTGGPVVATPGADQGSPRSPGMTGVDPIEEGSNAWAFAPSRTKSGRAILLRNPHLNWNAGYYEAHMTVPGVLDFYGDFRIGGPFGVVGGFNRDLGWATTNNAPDLDEIYALDVDPAAPDHYLFDGASLPLERELVTVAYRNGPGISTETRESWRTPLGPVIHRDGGKVYVLRAAGEGDWRGGEQFLRMMRASSLAQFKEAMRMRARVTSNFTYADRAGNIYYVWNASIPSLPHPSGGDTAAVPAHGTAGVWTRYVPFDSLPQLLNPRGGYVTNTNDPPYHTNLQQVLDRSRYPANFPEPALGLRSQHSLSLLDNKRKVSLEDVVAMKHSYGMLLADRVKGDLLAAVRGSSPDSATRAAASLLERWHNDAAAESRGAVLFENWWRRYSEGMRADSLFAEPWRLDAPASTPRGLASPARAAEAFAAAVKEVAARYGSADVAWGDVHRVRLGDVDVPVGGCAGAMGCFRVLNFRTDPDGKRSVIGGDGWVLAVEFGDVPRAYSVLAYGESAREDSPLHSDQAAMFARGEMKRVLFTAADVDAGVVRRYRP